MSEKGNLLELTVVTNGSSLSADGNAVPKDVAGRKQSSSKKFKIESVAAQDDPLYNSNAAAATSRRPSRRLSVEMTLGDLPPPPSYSAAAPGSPTRTDPEGTGGDSVFESVEDLTIKPRTFSNISNGSQYYSLENLDKPPAQSDLCNGASSSQVDVHEPPQSEVDSPTPVDLDTFPETDKKFARPGRPVSRRSAAPNQLRIDDSFYKKATVEMRADSENKPGAEAVADIFVPVPEAPSQEKPIGPSHDDYHETITSAYETNISINKLLRERHKGSLAAMGRFFGTKQKELEKERSAASLISAAVVNKPKKKKCYHCLRPIHFCLAVTFVIILSATVATLVTIESSRQKQFNTQGYHLDYKTRELSIYEMTRSEQIYSLSDTLFKAHLGVNIPTGLPYNCTESTDVSCYKWHNTSTVRLSSDSEANDSFCLDVEWQTQRFDPILEDCINLSSHFGHWYGGHLNRSKLSIGSEGLEFTTYLPGKRLGSVAERLWLSTNGIAVVAKHDFPLHVRVDAEEKRLCLSSWYGYQPGERKLSYSVCRSSDHRQVHKLVLSRYYDAYAERHLHDIQILHKPIFSVSGDAECRELLAKSNVSYSYIIDMGVQHSVLTDSSVSPSAGCGMNLSPFVALSEQLNLSSSVWLTSTDMDVPRLFNVNDVPHLLLNASSANLTTAIVKLPSDASENTFTFLTNLASGDIHGQEYYALNESVDTFQPYISNILALTSSNHSVVMSSVVSSSQKSPIVTYLPPVDDISERIRQVVHSSLLGYNLINPGEISASLSDEQLIRTLQLSTFMPVTQLSYSVLEQMKTPLVAEAWHKCVTFRSYKDFAENVIANFLTQSGNDYPLYAPVWWKQNDFSEQTADIADQFIFNNQYLVAPMVNTNATSRNVYFPPGYWLRIPFPIRADRDLDKKLYKGNSTVEINVALDEVLVFEHGEYTK